MFKALSTVLLCAIGWSAVAAEKYFVFNADTPGQPPRGFRSLVGGRGQPGDWQVRLEDMPAVFAPISPKATSSNKRPVVAQLSRDPTDDRYLLLAHEEEQFSDFTLTTRFKIVDGQAEQMAGVAFRMQDEKNYYYIRASALGTNLSFFRMVNGQPTDQVRARADIRRDQWHELVVECRGNQIRSSLNGKELILVTIPAGDALWESGQIAFWTKSDSVSYFADTHLRFSSREPFAQALVRDVLRKYPRLVGLKVFAAAPGQAEPRVIASHDPKLLGEPAGKVEKEVLAKDVPFYGKDAGKVLVTLPLHDKNGEPIAAVKITMQSFTGQTEQNALARALPIIRMMELRVPTVKDLVQ